jgi:cytochrome c peroxidase
MPIRFLLVLAAIALAACGGGGDAPAPAAAVEGPSALDSDVLSAAQAAPGLTGDPAVARGARQRFPDDDPLVKLGQLLFFSQTLAAGYDVSCGTCHHPDFGGSDGLSISVGVVPVSASLVGPGREVDPALDRGPPSAGKGSCITPGVLSLGRPAPAARGSRIVKVAPVPGPSL